MENDLNFFGTCDKQLWDGKTQSDQYHHDTREQISKTPLLSNFQIAVKTRTQPSVQSFGVFLYHDW